MYVAWFFQRFIVPCLEMMFFGLGPMVNGFLLLFKLIFLVMFGVMLSSLFGAQALFRCRACMVTDLSLLLLLARNCIPEIWSDQC